MAAFSQLTLAMRQRGAGRTAAGVGTVTAAVKDQGREVDKTSRKLRNAVSPVNALTRALKLAQTRTILWGGGLVGISILLAALSPGIAFLTGGLVALAAAMLPIAALGGIAALVFTNQFEIAGTAANELMTTFMDLRQEFERAFGPAANVILRGVAAALKILAPLITILAPPMKILADALAGGMAQFANGLVGMAPLFTRFIVGMVPLIPKLVDFMLALLSAFMQIAIRGLPAATVMLDWLIDLANWLEKAAINVDQFLHSAEGQQDLEHLKVLVEGIWWVLKGAAEAAFFVTTRFKELSQAIGITIGLAIVSKLLSWVLGFNVLTGAIRLASLALLEFPGTWIVLALVGLTVAVVEAYKHWDWFRDKIDAVWAILQQVPTIVWSGITSGLDAAGFGPDPIAPLSHVGEARPVGAGASSPLVPAGGGGGTSAFGALPNVQPQVVVPITTMLDGKVLSKSIHRQGVKKKSTK